MAEPVRPPPLVITCLLGLILASCATGTAQVRSGIVEVDKKGRIELVEGDVRVSLVGAAGRELAALPMALAKVWGTGNEWRVRVLLYQILDVGNGFSAYVGWVTYDQFGARLSDWRTGRVWELSGVSGEEFRGLHGKKIWLTGLEQGGDQLRPLDWGPLDGAAGGG